MPDISILLPTRGRTQSLKKSLDSLLDLCADPNQLELLLAFDDDDLASAHWFQENIIPEVDSMGVGYTSWTFERLGYSRLNQYVNFLAGRARGKWLMFWNDDAVMETQSWDQLISEINEFCVLRMPTHNQHPYAIFPIVPRAWYDLFGYMSQHQLSDAWISQIAYMIDIMRNIDIKVTHDRADLTGNNKDATFSARIMLEGKPWDKNDFNHQSWRQVRLRDADKLASWLENQGHDMTWYHGVRAGTQDPWAKMCSDEYDPNKQIQVTRSTGAS